MRRIAFSKAKIAVSLHYLFLLKIYDFEKQPSEKKDKNNDFNTYLLEARLDRMASANSGFKTPPKTFVPTKQIQYTFA
ncbi:MAG: hypothetical protein RIS64_2899 [Bacteroidota bacterium]